jgi:transcriptional regulator with XRE-family HTH domain
MKEKNLLKILGENIKRHRLRLYLSQDALAEKANISNTFMSSIERGLKWVSPATLIKLADAFQIDSYELLKPENVLPDNCQHVFNQYAEDIHFAMNSIRGKYLRQLGRR